MKNITGGINSRGHEAEECITGRQSSENHCHGIEKKMI